MENNIINCLLSASRESLEEVHTVKWLEIQKVMTIRYTGKVIKRKEEGDIFSVYVGDLVTWQHVIIV